MQRKPMTLIAISVLTCAMLTACGESIGDSAATSSANDASSIAEESSATANNSGELNFTYTANGTSIPINAECDPIIEKLGKPASTFEAPSCAFDGKSYTYTYDDFIVETYPDGDINRVYSVTLTKNSAKTAEGVTVGAGIADVTAACGEPDVESDAFLVYNGDGVDLQFFLTDEAVSTIVYTYHVG